MIAYIHMLHSKQMRISKFHIIKGMLHLQSTIIYISLVPYLFSFHLWQTSIRVICILLIIFLESYKIASIARQRFQTYSVSL